MKKYVAFSFALLLCACSTDALFPNTDRNIVTTPASQKVTLPSKTGTVVGDRVISYKNELNAIRSDMNKLTSEFSKLKESSQKSAQKYHEIVAEMETKLSLGTTPSNPQMVALYNNAQNALQDADVNTQNLNNVVAEVSALGASSAVLAQNIKSTYAVPGALDEDHANLRILENGTEQTAVALKNLLSEVNKDVLSQKTSTDNARAQLLRLNDAVARGNFNFAGPSVVPASSAVSAPLSQRTFSEPKPVNSELIDIDFSNENVDYLSNLESAIHNALSFNPNAKFLVKGVNPKGKKLSSDDAKKYAADVFADMISLGVSPEKINLSASQDNLLTTPHVLVYIK